MSLTLHFLMLYILLFTVTRNQPGNLWLKKSVQRAPPVKPWICGFHSEISCISSDLSSCPPDAPREFLLPCSQKSGPGRSLCPRCTGHVRAGISALNPRSEAQTHSDTSPASNSPPTQTTMWDLHKCRCTMHTFSKTAPVKVSPFKITNRSSACG